MTGDEELAAEGLAAQLYTTAGGGRPFCWWHVLAEDVKASFRKKAVAQISEFNTRNKAPWGSL